ncbi:MAG TPA: LysM peptidoglycan-binding domain-containing protein [Anaerolineales bacterium]|nr:LysM peptidoglycan-binding domain-containing protein [Anaerolineales bacterium]
MKKLLMALVAASLLLTAVAPVFADTIYIVQPGDNLFRISLKFNVSVSALMAANGITNPNLIFVGQRLVIPSPGTVVTPPATTTSPPPSGSTTTYVVQRGDTLYLISLRFNVSISALMAANGITNPNLIFVGQRLTIPGAGAPPTATPPPGATPAPTTPPSGSTVYIVQPGDVLWRIALKFGVSASAIIAANGLTNPNLLFVGQRLIIPVPGAAPTPAPTQGGTPAPTTVPPPSGSGGFELGGQVNTFSAPDKMKQAGMVWVKHQIRWSPGAVASVGDINDAHAKGFKVLFSVVGHPEDISGGRNFDNFANYVGELARLGADAIEVWNEMNLDREWPAGQINPTTYVDLLRRSYNAIKAKNANTLVISGAPSPTGAEGAFGLDRVWNDDRYIKGMAAAGAASYADCIGVHYNEGIISPKQTTGDPRDNYFTRYYQGMVSTYYNAFGGQRRLCFTELGYLSPEGYGPLPSLFGWAGDTSIAEHAQWLGEAASLAKSSGLVRLLIVFNVDFTVYGDDPQAGYAIIRADGACPACATLGAVVGSR